MHKFTKVIQNYALYQINDLTAVASMHTEEESDTLPEGTDRIFPPKA